MENFPIPANPLTKPQQALYNRFKNGERITHINKHHNDGGRYVWNVETNELCRHHTFWTMIQNIFGFGKWDAQKHRNFFFNL